MRFIILVALGLVAAACSSSGDKAGGAAATTAPAVAGPAAGSQAHLEQVAGSDRVFFDYDQHTLTDAAQAQVQRWAAWMLSNPTASILVEGHADERGTRDYNLALGARRSHAVKVALEGLGVSDSRIETTTFGKERPAVEGHNEAAWWQNRRSVVVVKGSASS